MDIDRSELEMVIELIEEDGPLDSLTDLYYAINDAMSLDVSHATLKNRIDKWGISLKTKASRGRKPDAEEDLSLYAVPRELPIHTPAGACPYKLKGIDSETVAEWVKKVQAFGAEKGLRYLAPAFIYFSREFYEIFSDEYETVKSHVRALLKA